jgi:hypothetical protein
MTVFFQSDEDFFPVELGSSCINFLKSTFS